MQESVSEFCDVLADSERREMISLLVKYANSLDRLAFLHIRSEEHKLLLLLSQKRASSRLQALKWASFPSILAVLAGALSALILSSL
ncbi:uncharacterized protein NEMAJ01_0681 [Nematocida major]|uniref:uncharacterized protein n=1 Tax=Nematocida major TaxID=1912982 RepID=UPI002007CF68|nr:uncharacterized protein NEMAJ01_0681 [Nematocida major]KAH9385785.1 hypothetical protein NEMAJ01_0681 [Nematocida major]